MVSRVARRPIEIPSSVDLKIDNRSIIVRGKLGELSQPMHPLVTFKREKTSFCFYPLEASKRANALTGTFSVLVRNMIHGVSQGFEYKLVLVGVGYRAKAEGSTLQLTLGLSHPVLVKMPENVTVVTPNQTEVVLNGPNKQVVSQVSADIRAKRPPEPYKGKGIRYYNERLIMKETKKKK